MRQQDSSDDEFCIKDQKNSPDTNKSVDENLTPAQRLKLQRKNIELSKIKQAPAKKSKTLPEVTEAPKSNALVDVFFKMKQSISGISFKLDFFTNLRFQQDCIRGQCWQNHIHKVHNL